MDRRLAVFTVAAPEALAETSALKRTRNSSLPRRTPTPGSFAAHAALRGDREGGAAPAPFGGKWCRRAHLSPQTHERVRGKPNRPPLYIWNPTFLCSFEKVLTGHPRFQQRCLLNTGVFTRARPLVPTHSPTHARPQRSGTARPPPPATGSPHSSPLGHHQGHHHGLPASTPPLVHPPCSCLETLSQMQARSRDLGGVSPPWDGALSLSRGPPNDDAVPSFVPQHPAEFGCEETPGRHRKPEDNAARPWDQVLNHSNHSRHHPAEACGEEPAHGRRWPGQAHSAMATTSAQPTVYDS